MSSQKSNRLVSDILENWEPRQSDIDFVQNLINTLNNGGRWAVPMNGQVYVFNHNERTITMVEGRVDTITHRTRTIAFRLGWRVLVAVKSGPDSAGHITVTECGNTN